jgi:hypothetical protein
VALDERLRTELERAGRPADPSGVYEDLIRRRERRRVGRRLGAGVLAVAVVAGCIAGVLLLARVFVPGSGQPAAGSGGVILFSGHAPGVPYGLLTVDVVTNEVGAIAGSEVGPPVFASWSPDGDLIAFVRDDEPGVFVTRADGSGTRLVSDAPAADPEWSPDGSRIAFTVPGTDGGIYVVDAEGVTTTWIARGAWASWSPDGASLVFTDRGQLMVQEADPDAVPHRLGAGIEGDRPDWSPDGTRIVFVRDDGVFITPVDGSRVDPVRSDPGYYLDPAWSPDGSKIAFAYQPPEGCPSETCPGRYELWMMDADGSGARRLASASDDDRTSGPSPQWYPVAGSAPPVVPVDQTPSPAAPISPTPSGGGRDLGLGFPVCDVSSLTASFLTPGSDATVFVATKKSDVPGCPNPEDASNVIALDADGDGLADTSYGPITCAYECRPFSAPDLDGDGTAELLVLQSGGTVAALSPYDVVPDGDSVTISPVTIAAPGDPQGGFVPGDYVRLLLGGDEFFHYALACGDPQMRFGPGLIATSAESLPHDSPEARWHAHRVTFALVDGEFRVMDVGDFTEPAGIDAPSFQSGETLCGSNLGP